MAVAFCDFVLFFSIAIIITFVMIVLVFLIVFSQNYYRPSCCLELMGGHEERAGLKESAYRILFNDGSFS